MAKVAVNNLTPQSLPMQYKTASGERFRWLRKHETIVMDDSRLHQSIIDLSDGKHVFLDTETPEEIQTGFEAL